MICLPFTDLSYAPVQSAPSQTAWLPRRENAMQSLNQSLKTIWMARSLKIILPDHKCKIADQVAYASKQQV